MVPGKKRAVIGRFGEVVDEHLFCFNRVWAHMLLETVRFVVCETEYGRVKVVNFGS